MDKGKRKPMKETNSNASVFIKPSGINHRSKRNETIARGRGRSAESGVENSSKMKHSFKKGPFLLPPASSSERVTKISQLDETVIIGKGSSEDGLENSSKLKSSSLKKVQFPLQPASFSEKVTIVSQVKLDLAYNEYLQTLLKQSMVQRQLKEHKTVLNGQLHYYSKLLNIKQQSLNAVRDQTELIKQQKYIIALLKYLEEKLEYAKIFFIDHQIESHMDVFKNILEKECNKVFLKNIKTITTQVEYDKFLNTLTSLQYIIDKITSSNVDYEDIHYYAEEIRDFLLLRDRVTNTQNELEKMEMEGIKTFLKKLSDMFAKQYEIKPINDLSD